MYNFDENKVRQEHQNGVDIIPKVESIVIFFILVLEERYFMQTK